MGFSKVLLGIQKWNDYSTGKDIVKRFDNVIQKRRADSTLQIKATQAEQQLAFQSGLGALGEDSSELAGLYKNIEIELNEFREGIDKLNADFNVLLGDVIWKLQIQQETFNDILQEIRISEFEREARAYRIRGEDAYFNGWYEEALKDFLEAETRNYKDFAVLRSIGNIYLYKIIDLPKALEYFLKAAKYARHCDPRQAAEAHLFAGIICGIQKQYRQGLSELEEAIELNQSLYQAYYLHSSFSAVLNDSRLSINKLGEAIKGDPRYYELAKNDIVFTHIRPDVQNFLDRLMHNVQEKARLHIEELKDVNCLAQKAGINYYDEIRKYEDYYKQNYYSVYLGLIPQAQEFCDQILQETQNSLKRKAMEKTDKIKNLQNLVKKLRDKKNRIISEKSDNTKLHISGGLFLIFFVIFSLCNYVYLAYINPQSTELSPQDYFYPQLIFSAIISITHIIGSRLYYLRHLQAAENEIENRESEIHPVVKDLSKDIDQIKKQIKELEMWYEWQIEN